MNGLQQEIGSFHKKIKPVLEKVLKRYGKDTSEKIDRTVKGPAKKLLQKCSFKSVSDTSRLCSLAYRLYIYGDKELALEICELTHGAAFDFEYRDRGIQNIYGLEVRIARELLGEDRRKALPPELLEHCLSKRVRKELRYPQILREEAIAVYSGRGLDVELLWALYDMIGKGETGLYPDLNKNRAKIEQTIMEYIAFLKAEQV